MRFILQRLCASALVTFHLAAYTQEMDVNLVCRGEVKEEMLFKAPRRLEKRSHQVVVDVTLKLEEGTMIMRSGYWGCVMPLGNDAKQDCFRLQAKISEKDVTVHAADEDDNLRATSTFTLSRMSGQLTGKNEAFVREGSDYKWSSLIGTVNMQCAPTTRQF